MEHERLLPFSYAEVGKGIPNMKIWHGTLNTLGFAWLSLNGYLYARNRPQEDASSH